MRSLLCSLIVLVVYSSAFSQEAVPGETISRDGKKAVCFGFDGLDLGLFNGGIGGKYWISDMSALYGSVEFSFSGSKREGAGNEDDVESLRRSVGMKLAVEKHLRVKKISPYIGVQLGFRLSKDTFERYGRADNEDKSASISSALAFGVEYWLTDNVSLAGQHTFGGSYEFGTSTRTELKDHQISEEQEQDTYEIRLGFGTSSLILSVYL
jgi:hypothetical protein